MSPPTKLGRMLPSDSALKLRAPLREFLKIVWSYSGRSRYAKTRHPRQRIKQGKKRGQHTQDGNHSQMGPIVARLAPDPGQDGQALRRSKNCGQRGVPIGLTIREVPTVGKKIFGIEGATSIFMENLPSGQQDEQQASGWSAPQVRGLRVRLGQTSSTVNVEDQHFVKTAAEGNIAEVQLGRLATEKASNGRRRWWAVQDSNLRPPACKAGALTS